MRLRIPAIGVDDQLTLATARRGVLYSPLDPRQVGWWPGSRTPGAAAGHAVLVAHTVHTGGGAFDRLPQLEPGQRITVSSGASSTSYVVRNVAALSRAQFASSADRIFARSGRPRLILLTCAEWNGERYLATEVITAVPVHPVRPADW
jgi:LPXTG-site transpeptidase (sortase) family protein